MIRVKIADTIPLLVRFLTAADHSAVLAIDRACFPDDRLTAKELALQTGRIDVIGLAAETRDGYLVGYLLYQLRKRSYRLLRMGVWPGVRRHGVGRSLVRRLTFGMPVPGGRNLILATVPEDQLGTQLFLKACGFECTAVKRAWYGEIDGYAFRFVGKGHRS